MVHRGGRLDRDAAGVERDALTDECNLLGLLALAAPIRQPHQPRWTRGTLAHPDDAAEAGLGQRLVVEHLDLQSDCLAQSLCPLGEFGREQVTRRGVHQVACGVDRDRDRGGAGRVLLGPRGGAQRGDLGQGGIFRRGLGAAELGEPVAAQDQALDRGLEVQFGQGCGDGLDTRQ